MSSAPPLKPIPESPENGEFQLRKLKAETEKAEAERDKTFDELRQSRQPLTKISKFFTPLGAILTIVLAYMAATYKSEVALAKLEKAQAELEKRLVLADKDAAEHDLSKAKTDLAATLQATENANSARKEAEAARTTIQNKLADVEGQYKNRITSGNLQKLVDLLDSEPAEAKTASSRYIEEIRREVAADAGYKAARLSYLIDAAQNGGQHADLRGLLDYAVFQVTNDNRWLDQIRRLAAQHTLEAWQTFIPLMRLKYFDSKDRADVVCTCYEKLRAPFGGPAAGSASGQHILFKLGKAAFVRCRKPYFDHLEVLRLQLTRSKGSQQRNEDAVRFVVNGSGGAILDDVGTYSPVPDQGDIIVQLPTQAVLIWYLSGHPKFDPKIFERIPFETLTDLQFPDDLISAMKSGSGTEWIERHPKLVTAWTSSNFPALSASSDSAMTRIMSGKWVAEADLP